MYHKNQVFIAACLGMLLFGIVFLSLGSVNNMLAERFALDNRAIGTLTALLPFGILLGSLVFGPAVDRFGYRWLLIAAALIVGGALEGMALTTSHAAVRWCVLAIGFGGGILNGATNALTADVSEGERGARLSLLGVFFGLGALAIPVAITTLSHRFSLSLIVAGIGALSLLPAIYCLAIAFPAPKINSERLALRKTLAMFKDPMLLVTCLALAVQSGMEGMSNDWMTRFFKHVVLPTSADERHVQLALVALTAAITLARLFLAGILKHVRSRFVLLASLLTTALGALVLQAPSTYASAFTFAGPLLIGCGLAAIFPVVLGYVGDRYPQQSGTAFSTIFVVALAGNMAINKSFGAIADHYGIARFPQVLLVLVVISAILLHLVNSLRSNPQTTQL